MGEQQMMSVPFAMHAAGAGSYAARSTTGHDPDEAIFQVVNSAGEVVFSVHESAVNIYVDDILYVTPGSAEVYIIEDGRKLLDGFSVFGLDEELRYADLFTATREAITVTRTFEVVPTVRTGKVTGITTDSAIGRGVVVDDDDQVVIDPVTGTGTYDFVNDVTGPQTILATFARAVMRIHDVESQPGEIFTVNLEILNTDEIYGFNLDIVIPDGFEFIEDSEELFRSDGHFLEVDTPQDNIVRIISGSVEQKPYTGTDGTMVSFELRSSQTSGTYSLVIQDAVIGNRNAVNIATGTIVGTVTIE